MKSFEAESVVGAAEAKRAERKFVAQIGGEENPSGKVLDLLDTPELELEGEAAEKSRIADTRLRSDGRAQDLRVSEAFLQSQGVEPGVNPNPTRTNEVKGSAREYFAKGPDDPLVETDALVEMRLKDPAKAERIAHLKRDVVSREADIMNLEQQIRQQQDQALRAAQEKVLAQFRRELTVVKKELEDAAK